MLFLFGYDYIVEISKKNETFKLYCDSHPDFMSFNSVLRPTIPLTIALLVPSFSHDSVIMKRDNLEMQIVAVYPNNCYTTPEAYECEKVCHVGFSRPNKLVSLAMYTNYKFFPMSTHYLPIIDTLNVILHDMSEDKNALQNHNFSKNDIDSCREALSVLLNPSIKINPFIHIFRIKQYQDFVQQNYSSYNSQLNENNNKSLKTNKLLKSNINSNNLSENKVEIKDNINKLSKNEIELKLNTDNLLENEIEINENINKLSKNKSESKLNSDNLLENEVEVNKNINKLSEDEIELESNSDNLTTNNINSNEDKIESLWMQIKLAKENAEIIEYNCKYMKYKSLLLKILDDDQIDNSQINLGLKRWFDFGVDSNGKLWQHYNMNYQLFIDESPDRGEVATCEFGKENIFLYLEKVFARIESLGVEDTYINGILKHDNSDPEPSRTINLSDVEDEDINIESNTGMYFFFFFFFLQQ